MFRKSSKKKNLEDISEDNGGGGGGGGHSTSLLLAGADLLMLPGGGGPGGVSVALPQQQAVGTDSQDNNGGNGGNGATLTIGEDIPEISQRRKSSSKRGSQSYHNIDKNQILKEIFSLPLESPSVQLNSQLSDPKSILNEYLPLILKFLEWSALFLFGYCGFSYAWIITIALLYWSVAATRLNVNGSCSSSIHEKESIQLAQSGHSGASLPSWVAFPDVERAEWINIIMKKVWPNVGEISRQIAKRLVEPKIKEILNRLNLEGLSNFKLKNFLLGSVPARVGGIKVYDRNTGRDEIVMDINIIYEGDACVNFSVQNFDCEVNQITFRGTVRLTIKPLIDSIPLIGGFEIYFMQMPEYDYSLGKMGALGDMPGISNIIRSTIDNIIRRGFVWPNRFNFFFPIESVRNLQDQTFAMPSPQGVLHVIVSEARHLMKKDKHLIGGKSDPYITLAIGEKKISFRDRYIENTVNPVWNYSAEFPVEEASGLDLKLEAFDYDAGSEDDFLGRTSIPVSTVIDDVFDRWITLDDAKHGEVKVRAVWKPVRVAALVDGPSSSYVACIFVDSCTSLTSGRSSAPWSKCELKLCSGPGEGQPPLSRKDSKKWTPSGRFESYTTKPRGPSEDPVFKEGHFFLTRNPTLDAIVIQVVEQGSNIVLGTVCVKVSYIASLPDRQFTKMEWKLESSIASSAATIVLSAKLFAF